ncbi:MAG: hypothetical protein ACKV2V_19880 [Blastocatellia bacterium]
MNLNMLAANSPFHPVTMTMTDADLAEQLRLDEEDDTEENEEDMEGDEMDDDDNDETDEEETEA